jgi:hypothetical protein
MLGIMNISSRRIAGGCAAVWSGLLVLIATRRAPLMSPDSMTYLAAAQNIAAHGKIADFTGQPLTVFGPLYPLLLSPGGTSLAWARVIGALSVAVASLAMYIILNRRVSAWWALLGAIAFGSSLGLVRVASTVWSEAPYMACSLLVLALLARSSLTDLQIVAAGALAGVGFLTRYAGIGLVLTGLIVITTCRGVHGRRAALGDAARYLGAAVAVAGIWVTRNLVLTGEALGPRFEGGATEALSVLLRRPFPALGQLILGDHFSKHATEGMGIAVVLALLVATVVVFRIRPIRPIDAAMCLYGLTSVAIPVVARAVTSNDIEHRVMSPTLIPVVYFAIVGADRVAASRIPRLVGLAAIVWWSSSGVVTAWHFPERLPSSSGSRSQFSPALYDVIDGLPDDALVLTNNPWRVWWQSRREPILFAYTRPRAGNSHYPLSVEEIVKVVCTRDTYLAWFSGMANAGKGPTERRPDLEAVIKMTPLTEVDGGTLYHLAVVVQSVCAQF